MAECRNSTPVHLFAGGLGGTTAAIATCPLEVVKTRLQSSAPVFQPVKLVGMVNLKMAPGQYEIVTRPAGILGCIRHMIHTEGVRSLYKGLGPNLVGVAPARAIYFAVYAKSSKGITRMGVDKDSPLVHTCAGASAGFITNTFTAPIWFVKTRLQLSSQTKYGMMKCARKVFKEEGIKGFYRGLSASYFGIIETIIHFVIYERLKRILREYHKHNSKDHIEKNNVSDFMIAAGFSKSIASMCAYPHEVVRTRLRQEECSGPRKYKSFFQTLMLVYREEGRRGLYSGLGTQLVRQVPNSAVMFMVYEAVIYYICSNENV